MIVAIESVSQMLLPVLKPEHSCNAHHTVELHLSGSSWRRLQLFQDRTIRMLQDTCDKNTKNISIITVMIIVQMPNNKHMLNIFKCVLIYTDE